MRQESAATSMSYAAAATKPATFDVTAVHSDANRVVIRLRGELDLASADLLAAVLDNQRLHGRHFVSLDMSRLTFIDCAGLGVLVQAHEQFLAVGGTLVLTGVGPRVERLLALTDLDRVLSVAEGPILQPARRRGRQRESTEQS